MGKTKSAVSDHFSIKATNISIGGGGQGAAAPKVGQKSVLLRQFSERPIGKSAESLRTVYNPPKFDVLLRPWQPEIRLSKTAQIQLTK